jgi:glycosyltransferase involved in cell wall biosynthesis
MAEPTSVDVSVVIPLLNNGDTIGEQLDALAAQTFTGTWEVIVSDNGSTDGGPDEVLRWQGKVPSLRVVDAADQPGTPHARNVGAGAGSGRLVLVCEADDAVAPEWVAAMAKGLEGCDLAGGRFDVATLNDPVVRSWRWMPNDRLLTPLSFLPYAMGANCAVTRDAWEKLGGWNEAYFKGGDDVEFSWRAQLAGYRLCFVPDAVVAYRYRPGLKALARQYYAYGRTSPRLYRDFRDRGVPRRSARATARDWLWLVLHLPGLAFPRARGTWIRQAALSWGYVRESLKQRVLYL